MANICHIVSRKVTAFSQNHRKFWDNNLVMSCRNTCKSLLEKHCNYTPVDCFEHLLQTKTDTDNLHSVGILSRQYDSSNAVLSEGECAIPHANSC